MTKSYTRYRPNRFGPGGGHKININGEWVNIHYARLVYRCAICLSGLKRVDAGLKCKQDESHRGFVHQTEVKRLEAQQQQNIQELEQFYDIVDGKVIIK